MLTISRSPVFKLLLLCCALYACTEPVKKAELTNIPQDKSTITQPAPDTDTQPEDPTFVLTQDTVSPHGPHSITRNVLMDRHGNIWLATWEGIIRYDGKRFTNITLQAGLRHFHPFSMLEDPAGNLWFGMIGGGVYRYDGEVFQYFNTDNGLINNTVSVLMADNFGHVWLGTDGGLTRYDGAAFTHFTTQEGLNNNFVSALAQDKTGKIWVGTRSGVCCYDGNGFTPFNDQHGKAFYRVKAILPDHLGNIWIGGADGLFKYDGKNTVNVSPYSFLHILEDKKGMLWMSASEADHPNMILLRYDGKSFTKIIEKRQVFGLCEDHAGNIWFGTEQGVCRYDGKSVREL